MSAVPQPDPNHTEALTYIAQLHGNSTGYLSLFAFDRTTGRKIVRFAHLPDRIDALARYAVDLDGCCVWLGIAPRRKANDRGARGGSAECVSLPALWVDIDIAGPNHAADDLPATWDAAVDLLNAYPIPPTAVINTGGGLQAYWAFAEPIDLDDDADTLLARWGATWQRYAADRRYGIDNVWDPARVLRIPGTTNHKTPAAQPVHTVTDLTDWTRRFGVDDLDQWLIDPPAPPARHERSTVPWIGPQRPGDAFNAIADPADLIERYGCVHDHTDRNGDRHYRAPHRGPRETTGITIYGDDNHTTIYSETFARAHGLATKRPYDPFGLYAALEHGGDWQNATRALADAGYGQRHDVTLNDLVAAPTPTTPAVPPTISGDGLNLPDEFWQRPSLAHIRQAAHSATRSADAVLVGVMARAAALIPPAVTLPAIVGSRASLNLLTGIVATSGAGKSSAVDVARDLIPSERTDVLLDLPPGSGEGITELYFEMVPEEQPDGKTKAVKRQTKSGALLYLDEGEALAKMGGRDSSTLMPTLRSAWSGQTIGQMNASVETRRHLKAHSYRLSVVVGFQIEYAAALIADQVGGTPQRFVFAWALDPTIPDQQPEWPGPITITPPPITPAGSTIGFHTDIVTEIRARSLRASRGEHRPDPIDAHRDLVKMKVAALLAIIDQRFSVDLDDWALAEMVMTTSAAVRSRVTEHAAHVARASEASYARKLANREQIAAETAEERALVSGAKSIARKVHGVGGECSKRDLHHAVASRHRQLVSVDDMLQYAVQQDWIRRSGEGFVPGESKAAK